MAKASDNLYPYVHLVPAAAPSSPASGSQRVYLDSADSNKLKRKDSSGTVTTIEGGSTPTYVGVKAYRSAAYNLVDSAVTAFPWDAEKWDTNTFHDNSTNNSRLTVPSGQEGKYQVSCALAVTAALVGRFLILVQKNGATVVEGGVAETSIGGASSFPAPSLTCEVDMSTAGDYIEILYFQSSGATKAVATDKCGVSMRRIG